MIVSSDEEAENQYVIDLIKSQMNKRWYEHVEMQEEECVSSETIANIW